MQRQPPLSVTPLLYAVYSLPLQRPLPVLLLNSTPDARCCACRAALYVPPRSPAARLGARHCRSVAAASPTFLLFKSFSLSHFSFNRTGFFRNFIKVVFYCNAKYIVVIIKT